MHFFQQEINKKINLVCMMYRSLKVSHLFAPLPPKGGLIWCNNLRMELEDCRALLRRARNDRVSNNN
jgi:hypothetical protein